MENKSLPEEQFIKWMENTLSPEERKELESSDDFKYYKKIMDEADSWSVPPLNISNSFAKLMEKKNNKKSKEAKQIALKPFWLSVAASITLLIGFFAYNYIANQTTVHQTGVGEMATVELPDGSLVHLNAQSEIAYRRKKWDKKRSIELKGNAYFDVAKGGTFDVHSDHGIVTVTGTEFEINDGNGFYTVECLEGSVEVAIFEAKETVILKTNDVISYTRKRKLDRSKTSRGKGQSWANGSSSFKNTPLSQVFTAIERQFGVEFDFGKVDIDRKFTGEFSHKNIEIALKMVCVPMQISYVINGKKIILK